LVIPANSSRLNIAERNSRAARTETIGNQSKLKLEKIGDNITGKKKQ
jgi:hypothetical protein